MTANNGVAGVLRLDNVKDHGSAGLPMTHELAFVRIQVFAI